MENVRLKQALDTEKKKSQASFQELQLALDEEKRKYKIVSEQAHKHQQERFELSSENLRLQQTLELEKKKFQSLSQQLQASLDEEVKRNQSLSEQSRLLQQEKCDLSNQNMKLQQSLELEKKESAQSQHLQQQLSEEMKKCQALTEQARKDQQERYEIANQNVRLLTSEIEQKKTITLLQQTQQQLQAHLDEEKKKNTSLVDQAHKYLQERSELIDENLRAKQALELEMKKAVVLAQQLQLSLDQEINKCAILMENSAKDQQEKNNLTNENAKLKQLIELEQKKIATLLSQKEHLGIDV